MGPQARSDVPRGLVQRSAGKVCTFHPVMDGGRPGSRKHVTSRMGKSIPSTTLPERQWDTAKKNHCKSPIWSQSCLFFKKLIPVTALVALNCQPFNFKTALRIKAKRRKTEKLEIQGSKEQQIKSCPSQMQIKIMPAKAVQGNKKGFYKYNQKKIFVLADEITTHGSW